MISGSISQMVRMGVSTSLISLHDIPSLAEATAANSSRTCTLMTPPSATSSSARSDLVVSSESPRLDDGPVRNGCVFDYDDNAASDDKAQLFPVRLLHAVFIHDLYIATDACVFVDDGSSDRGVGTDSQRNFPTLHGLQTF